METDLPSRILQCARDLYLEEGFTGVSMRKVGARAGVTAPALYRHFRNKDDLMGRVYAEGLEIFGAYLQGALIGESPLERLFMSGERYLDFALEHTRYYELIFMADSSLWRTERPDHLPVPNEATFRFLADRVRDCMESRVLRKDAPEEVAMTIWSHGHGLIALYLAGRFGDSAEQFRTRYRESNTRLFAGLAQPMRGHSIKN